jgi:hypothetical protein
MEDREAQEKTHRDNGDIKNRIYVIKDFCNEKKHFLSETEKAFVLSWCGRWERKERARDHSSCPARKN